jgi:hypothetical protein
LRDRAHAKKAEYAQEDFRRPHSHVLLRLKFDCETLTQRTRRKAGEHRENLGATNKTLRVLSVFSVHSVVRGLF